MNKLIQAEQVLKAMGSSRRLQILQYIDHKQSATVGELAKAMGISLFSTSQHLRALRSAQLVMYKKRGRYVTYRLPLKRTPLLKEVLKMIN